MMSQLTLATAVVVVVVPVPVVLVAAADADALGEALACAPRAVWLMFAERPPPENAMTPPTTSASATGMARGTAMRTTRLRFLRRRHADRWPETMGFTSVFALLPGRTLGQAAAARLTFATFKLLRS